MAGVRSLCNRLHLKSLCSQPAAATSPFIFKKKKKPTQPLLLIHTGSASVLNSRSTAASGSSKNEPIPRLICGHPIVQDPRAKTSPCRIVRLMSASPTFGKLREENCREFHTNLGSQITNPKPTVLQVCTGLLSLRLSCLYTTSN